MNVISWVKNSAVLLTVYKTTAIRDYGSPWKSPDFDVAIPYSDRMLLDVVGKAFLYAVFVSHTESSN